MEFHIGLLPNVEAESCIQLTRMTESLGYAGVWLADSHSVFRDAYALLAVLARETRSISLATGVTNTVTRHPAVLANAWATLHELSGGRAIMGVGVGESSVRNLGLRPERLKDFETKLEAIRALIEGRPADFAGRELRMDWSDAAVPLVMACSGPKSLQLGGRIADGVLFQVGSDPSLVQYALDNIRVGAEASGRRLEDLKLIMRVACAIGPDREAARDAVKGYAAIGAGTTFATVPREYMNDALYEDLRRFKENYDYQQHGSNQAHHREFLTDRILDSIAIAGTLEDCLPRVRELASLPIGGICWTASMPDPGKYIQYFADNVMSEIA